MRHGVTQKNTMGTLHWLPVDCWAFQMFLQDGQEKIQKFTTRNFWQD